MQKLPMLKAGDSVEVIAPAARCSDQQLADLVALLQSWQLNCVVSDLIFGRDLLCANTDNIRFESLKNALQNPETKAVICARGGYGSLRLIPALTAITPPPHLKLFVGMSDITTLHLYLQQKWQWPTLHGALTSDKFSSESIEKMRSLLFGEADQIEWVGVPLNQAAQKQMSIEATVIGGNLSLIQASIGTAVQLYGEQKIIFIEEVSERGYRVDRMLEHLRQANIFKAAAAIVFGDFIKGEEPNGTALILPVLKRFAESIEIPVIQIAGVGHGYTNFPLPFGTAAKLQLGEQPQLICDAR